MFHIIEMKICFFFFLGCASDTCIMQCPFISSDRRPCDCKDKSPVYNSTLILIINLINFLSLEK